MKFFYSFFCIFTLLGGCSDANTSETYELKGSYFLDLDMDNTNKKKTNTLEESADYYLSQNQKEIEKKAYPPESQPYYKTLVIFFHGMGDSEKITTEGSDNWQHKKNNPGNRFSTDNEYYVLKKNFEQIESAVSSENKKIKFEFAKARTETLITTIDAQAQEILDNVRNLIESNRDYDICFFGYSMGGLVAEVLAKKDTIKNAVGKRFFSLITLGSPVLGINYNIDLEFDLMKKCEIIKDILKNAINKKRFENILKSEEAGNTVNNLLNRAFNSTSSFKFIFENTAFKKKEGAGAIPIGIKDMLKDIRKQLTPPQIPVLNIVARASSVEIFKYAIKRFIELENPANVTFGEICELIDDPKIREDLNPIFAEISDSLNKKIEATPNEVDLIRHDGIISTESQYYNNKNFTNCERIDVISHHNELPAKKSVVIESLKFINKKSYESRTRSSS